tara:strand:- start:755 stop:955 length:201 start_codon:yes stop_codon:yes gene_type:complete
MEEGNANELKRLSHEFEIAKLKSMILNMDDIEEVKSIAFHMVEMLDGAKMMIAALVEEEALKKKYE